MPKSNAVASYRHWQNRGIGGDTIFATTTVLDFVRAFDSVEAKEAMCGHIFRYCRRSQAQLHAFVLMSHHVHLLLRLPSSTAVSPFLATFKREATNIIRPMLPDWREKQLTNSVA